MRTTTQPSYSELMATMKNEMMIKKKRKGKLAWYDKLIDYIRSIYMEFLLITTLYVMEPWEKIVVLSFSFCILSLITYSALVYIPFHIDHILDSTIPTISAMLKA